MGRSDVALVVVVAAFAAFVAEQVVHRPHAVKNSLTAASASQVIPQTATASHAASADTRSSVAQSTTAAPERNLDNIRARIAAANGTYMSDMLADLNGMLVRWPDRREAGLRVWVQSATSVRDWDLRYAQMARDAVADWDAGGLPMRLDFVLDSATSDIHIVWIDRFPPDAGQRVGTTNRTTDQNGWIVRAEITVAVHDSAGQTIQPAALAGIVRHEAGHALGLGHSRDAKTKMYPVEMANDIAAADRATLRLLYQLPPGTAR